MNRTNRAPRATLPALALVLAATVGVALVACGSNNVMTPDPETPHTESTAGSTTPVSSASAAASTQLAPCGPNDCVPCDERKGKCMGPMVCDHHPEKASRQCKRDTDGQCKDMIVCAP